MEGFLPFHFPFALHRPIVADVFKKISGAKSGGWSGSIGDASSKSISRVNNR